MRTWISIVHKTMQEKSWADYSRPGLHENNSGYSAMAEKQERLDDIHYINNTIKLFENDFSRQHCKTMPDHRSMLRSHMRLNELMRD